MYLGTSTLPCWVEETCRRVPTPPGPSWSPRQSKRLQNTLSITHLQNEGLAVKGNLDGVHSVPIFLWQGEKGSGEVSGGQKRAGVGARMGDGQGRILTAQGRKL